MKAPLSWLRDYVEIQATPVEVANALRMVGVGIEGIEGDVLDLEITANRADLLSMMGVAREVALVTGKALREPDGKVAESAEDVTSVASVTTEDLALCPRYIARVVKGVKVGPSPAWMQAKLAAAGVRPVNNVVDITNFVLLESGQPLHAFDLAILRGPKIVVRLARPGEKMTAIDGKEYELTPDNLVIADADHPAAIAGVMGGRESEIGGKTRDVLIESARFDPVSIRRTSRRLGLTSESSYRFERGVDWDTVEWASCRAAQLMAELGGGKVCRGSIDVAAAAPEKATIRLRLPRMKKVLGYEISSERSNEILVGLGCRVQKSGDVYTVEAPPRRRDLRAEIDLIEEIARVEGYDKVPTDTALGQRASVDRRDDLVRERIRETLTSLGSWEVCTWSFEEAGEGKRLVPLRDPQGRVDRLLRESIAPELLRVLARNESYKEPLRPIFEIATVYFPKGDAYGEKRVLALAAPGGALAAKGAVGRVMEDLGLPVTFPPEDAPFLRRGTSASVVVGCKAVGYVGQFREAAGLEAGAGVAEVDFEALVEIADLDRRFRDFSRRPPVDRDVAIVVADDSSWRGIEATVRGAAPDWLESVSVFDVYRGRQVPGGKKSVAFSLRFRAMDRTLTGEEVDAAIASVVEALKRDWGAVLRG